MSEGRTDRPAVVVLCCSKASELEKLANSWIEEGYWMAHFSHATHGGHSGTQYSHTADPEDSFSAVMQRKKAEIEKDAKAANGGHGKVGADVDTREV